MRTFARSASVMAVALAVTSGIPRPASLQAMPTTDAEVPAWVSVLVDPGRATRLQLVGKSSDPAITAALERISGRPPEISEWGAGWVQWSTELPAPSRGSLIAHQALPIGPILEALGTQGQSGLSMLIQVPRVAFVTLHGAPAVSIQRGTLSATIPTSGPPSRLDLEFGWRPADVAVAVAFLLLALLAPLAAALVIWRRSIAHDRTPDAWFLRAQAIQIITLAGWVLWMAAVEATQAADFTAFALAGRRWSRVTAPLWIMGFLPVSMALMAILRRNTRRLRGYDPLPRGIGGPLGQVRGPVALFLAVVAITALSTGNYRAGVFAALAAIAVGVLLPGARGPFGLTPQSLSSGALRDRLFDLARRAGVTLRELYVVPMRSQRMANAFAVHGGVVMVADELLDRMTRREVDAVLAHEITHLEHHHPIKTLFAAVGLFLVILMGAPMLGMPYAFPVAFVACWLTYLFVARRFEFAADAGAAALTSDAEAAISQLGHLSRLNDAPLAWSRGWRWLVTHPTTEARGLAIGRRAGLAPERVTDLLNHGLPAAERYGHHDRPGEAERIFSTAWKLATTGPLTLAMFAAAVVAPAAGLALAGALGLPLPHVVVILGGAVVALGAMLIVHDSFAARIVSQLEPALRRRLEEPAIVNVSAARPADGVPPQPAALFVALSPGDRPRIYEGFLDWDLGLLTMGVNHIHYRGEQVTLDLPRHAVRAIEIGAVAPGWIRAPRVIVRWTGPSGEEALTLRAADARRTSAIGPASHALRERLRAWRDAAAPAAAALDPAIADAPPGIGPVTSMRPAAAAAPRDLPALAFMIATLSAAASFTLGLDLWLGADVFAAALTGVIALRWPMMTSREPLPAKVGAPEPERRAA